jgi:hypothetical protein
MRVVLIETEGRGGAAEIECFGQRLRVVDEYSGADAPAAPGILDDATLDVVLNPHLTRRAPAASESQPGIERDHGWRYRGSGRIVMTQPLRADLGPLQLELEDAGLAETQAWAEGDAVFVAIDRITLERESA